MTRTGSYRSPRMTTNMIHPAAAEEALTGTKRSLSKGFTGSMSSWLTDAAMRTMIHSTYRKAMEEAVLTPSKPT